MLLAPGNLTHRLDLRVENAANGEYFEEGKKFDQVVCELVSEGRTLEITDIDPELWQAAAPEANLCNLSLIAGATGNAPGKILQYHGAIFSVGDVTFAFDTLDV